MKTTSVGERENLKVLLLEIINDYQERSDNKYAGSEFVGQISFTEFVQYLEADVEDGGE